MTSKSTLIAAFAICVCLPAGAGAASGAEPRGSFVLAQAGKDGPGDFASPEEVLKQRENERKRDDDDSDDAKKRKGKAAKDKDNKGKAKQADDKSGKKDKDKQRADSKRDKDEAEKRDGDDDKKKSAGSKDERRQEDRKTDRGRDESKQRREEKAERREDADKRDDDRQATGKGERERSERRRRDDDGDRRARAERKARDEGRKTSAKDLQRLNMREGQSTAIDGGERTLRREGDRVIILNNDRDRFDRGRQREERLDGGRTRVVVDRPDGSAVITIRADDGEIVRRVRRTRDGREIVIINETESRRGRDDDRDRGRDRRSDRRRDGDRYGDRDGRDDRRHGDRDGRHDRRYGDRDHRRYRDRDFFSVELGPLRINIPRERYIVETRRASRHELEEALLAPPVERVERDYSLEEVRWSERLRDKMRRIDVSSITFETDSADISRSQIDEFDELGYILGSIIDRRPDELFLIEGHTDAVGADIYNLALSDRRAESVAIALSDYYDVPPENLVTQGYGESYLKIPTPEAERENRRVTVRRITPLIRSAGR